MTQATDLIVTRHFEAAPERVFDAWVEPEIAKKWLFATPHGQLIRVEIDARVGGVFTITDRRDGQDMPHVGVYQELERPRRLAFDFRVGVPPSPPTRITVELAPQASGCELRFCQANTPVEFLARSEKGWNTLFDRLASVL